MAVEDFTTYTEVDGSNFITETSTKVTAVNASSGTACYLYKDYTANHFDALNANFETYAQDEAVNPYGFGVIQLCNTLPVAWASDSVSVGARSYSSSQTWIMVYRGKSLSDQYIGSPTTLYYLTVSRATGNDAVTVKIYSDNARTNLLDTLSLAGFGTTKWRYSLGFTNYDGGEQPDERQFNGYIQNLDFDPTPSASVSGNGISFGTNF